MLSLHQLLLNLNVQAELEADQIESTNLSLKNSTNLSLKNSTVHMSIMHTSQSTNLSLQACIEV